MSINSDTERYDAVVVGGRAAGAATAMLMARQGLDVLVVDRAAHGSDTLSTHALLAPAVHLLDRWGLLEAVAAGGAPAIEATRMTYGNGGQEIEFDLSDRPLYAPRRTHIDPLLADAALLAGADVRFDTPVKGLLRDIKGNVNGVSIETSRGVEDVRASLVIGADGIRSFVAREVEAPVTYRGAEAMACVMGYFEGIDRPNAYHWHHTTTAAAGSIPTNDDGYAVFGAVSKATFRAEVRDDVEAGFLAALDDASPDLADRVRNASGASRLRSWPGERSFTKQAAGPGWALVGDAGSFIDPMTAHGMSAAFRDAQAVADAAACALGDPAGAADAWAAYEAGRDEIARPMIDAVDRIVAFNEDIDAIQQAHIALAKLVGREVKHIVGLDQHADPCLRAAA